MQLKKLVAIIFTLVLVVCSAAAIAADGKESKKLMILFTHDLHSYFLPHRILTPEGKQLQQGGFAKLAYLISDQRIKNQNKTLRVDAGDFSMGTLFHTSYLKEASELRLMGKMGYDVVTFGNHDFDFHADGLAKMLRAARDNSKQLPALVAANVVFSKNDPGDSALKQEFKNYPVKEYTVLERNGIRIGIFGIMGDDAAADTPFAKPVSFADPIRTAKKIAAILQDKEKVDMILCLSHSGTSPIKSKSEDEILAKKVPAIDVIISGHTHTVLPQPIIVGTTIIVSAGSYSEYLGMLEISYAKGKGVKLVSYNLKNITADIPETKIIAEEVARYKRIVEQDFLVKYHLSFDQVIAQSDYNMESLPSAYANPREMGLGNMITDSFRYAVQKAEGKNYEYVNLALEPLGLIRDSFQKGKITVADVFQVLSLGLGADGVAGYPLVAFYINGKELKDVLEVEASASLIKEDAHLQVSGVKFAYNPHRIPLDRVTKVQVQEADGQYRPLNPQKLYRICANRYAAEMINYVVHVTHGLLNVQPKDKNGKALKDLKEAIIYLDGKSPKSGELKEWLALTQFMSSFKGTNLSQKYSCPEDRYHAEPSWSLKDLVANNNAITYGALILGFILICLMGFIIRYVVRRIKILRQSPMKH